MNKLNNKENMCIILGLCIGVIIGVALGINMALLALSS